MTWLNLVQLGTLPQFSQLTTQISRNDKAWKNWFDEDAPEEAIIPDGYSTSLDVFRKLLLVRSWAPDRTVPQARNYIADSIGVKVSINMIRKSRSPRIEPCGTPQVLFRKVLLVRSWVQMGQYL